VLFVVPVPFFNKLKKKINQKILGKNIEVLARKKIQQTHILIEKMKGKKGKEGQGGGSAKSKAEGAAP
jgi:hypothetical protein